MPGKYFRKCTAAPRCQRTHEDIDECWNCGAIHGEWIMRATTVNGGIMKWKIANSGGDREKGYRYPRKNWVGENGLCGLCNAVRQLEPTLRAVGL